MAFISQEGAEKMEMRPHHCSFKLWKPIEPSTKNFSTNHKLTGLLLVQFPQECPTATQPVACGYSNKIHWAAEAVVGWGVVSWQGVVAKCGYHGTAKLVPR